MFNFENSPKLVENLEKYQTNFARLSIKISF